MSPDATTPAGSRRRVPAVALIVAGVVGIVVSISIEVLTLGLLGFLASPLLKLSVLLLAVGALVIGARRLRARAGARVRTWRKR